jgi:hypothetical protein
MKTNKLITVAFTMMMMVASPIIKAQNWDLTGNAVNGTEKLGTNNNFDLNFYTNNLNRMTLKNNGWLGVGTTQPRGWQEINYCPIQNQKDNGLIVTLNHCYGNSQLGDVNIGDRIGGGILPYNVLDTGESLGSVFNVPLSFRTGNNTSVLNPLYDPNKKPMLWVRQQSPNGFWQGSTPDKFDTKFIVMPDGSCGINIVHPRAALDVRGSNIKNRPAAIIGSRSIGTTNTDSSTGLINYYTQQVHFVPILGENGYNQIVKAGDQGMFFSDGLGNKGSNLNSAFIIAPWAQDRDSSIGGMRMDKLGNTEFHGSVRSTKITVDATWWSDFVFADDYKLRPLSEVESFIIVNKHLPDMPNENELIDEGIDVANMQALQQQKIEELTLYIIQLQKQMEAMKSEMELLKK